MNGQQNCSFQSCSISPVYSAAMTLHDPRSDIGVKGDTSGLKLCCLMSDLPMATMAGSLPKGSNTLAFSSILKCVRDSWRRMKEARG